MPESEIKTTALHALYSVIIAIIVRAILFIEYHSLNIFDELKLDAFIVICSTLFIIMILFLRIRAPVSVLLKIDALINKKIRKQFYNFVANKLNNIYGMLINIQSDGGAILEVNDANELTKLLCFGLGEGKYDGIDSNIPSRYYTLYPDYLEAHEKNVNIKRNPPGTRILIVEKDEMIRDFRDNYDMAFNFIAWHIKNKVTLKIVDPSKAREVSGTYKLLDNITDVGIWHDKYVLFFKPLTNGKIKLYMRFLGDEQYGNVLKYFSALDKKAAEIDLGSILKNGVMGTIEKREQMKLSEKLFGYRLAIEWEDFVNCEKRLKKEVPFLNALIIKYKKENEFTVFDAALGIGCESIFLLKKGIKVISNEKSPTFQTIAYQKAVDERVDLEITQWDWVELDVKFKELYGNLRVNMVLLVGNSLCLLTDINDIKKSLTNIKSILAPGGVLLIDGRNFDYILGDIDKILEDPISNFRYNGDVIYCGDLVRGVPTDKPEDKDNVVFSYYRIPQSEQEEMDSYKILERNLIGKLEMYPFKNNELKNLLESVGFVNIKTYSDFEEGYNKNADFFIYVAEVPST